MGDKKAIDALKNASEGDPEEGVRDAAREALSKLDLQE